MGAFCIVVRSTDLRAAGISWLLYMCVVAKHLVAVLLLWAGRELFAINGGCGRGRIARSHESIKGMR